MCFVRGRQIRTWWKAFARGGMSAPAVSRKHGTYYTTFYYWRRRQGATWRLGAATLTKALAQSWTEAAAFLAAFTFRWSARRCGNAVPMV